MIREVIALKKGTSSEGIPEKGLELRVSRQNRLSTARVFAKAGRLKYVLDDRYIKPSSLLHERPAQNYELRTEKEQRPSAADTLGQATANPDAGQFI